MLLMINAEIENVQLSKTCYITILACEVFINLRVPVT